jgi:hypothetical protein
MDPDLAIKDRDRTGETGDLDWGIPSDFTNL